MSVAAATNVRASGFVRRVARGTAGVALGAATAFPEFGLVLLGGLVLAIPAARRWVLRGARSLTGLERARLARFHGVDSADDYDGWRATRYLALRCVVGMLAAGIFLLILWGLVSVAIIVRDWSLGTVDPDEPFDGGMTWYDPIVVGLFGLLLLFLAVQGLVGVATLDRILAGHFLGPSPRELLRRRVSELASTRAGVVDAVNDERRRIERDLHDGVQQRLVALGMLLGRARRAATDPDRATRLLGQAHEQSQQALRELREVTWRVYPVVLDESGLSAALEAVAERASVPVHLRYTLDRAVAPAIETVAYFVVSEAVTNAIKHGAPTRIDIDVDRCAELLVVRVRDDGRGGAMPSGNGLSGLARRVAAADGEFTVDSPPGGPTVISARFPCE